ncbi:MAG: hypothetical protein AB8H79_03055 [Myxococcota bacterium]
MFRGWLALLISISLLTGCFYRAGNKLAEGLLDEALGDTRDRSAVDSIAEDTLEKQLMRKLGQQLGEGLASGATTISEEQKRELEDTIESIIAVAAVRSGKGLREEVGPEFRQIVRRDIVQSFSDGLRGDLGDSLEETADRVVTRTIASLERELGEQSLRFTLAEILRDSVHDAVEGGTPASPGIGEVLEETLTNKLLDPFSDSVGGVADRVALQVNASAERTENLLKTIIGGLFVVLGVLVLLYFVRDRQARRARESVEQAQQGLRSVTAAIDQLDPESRRQLIAELGEVKALVGDDPAEKKRRRRSQKPPSSTDDA